ncbi:Hypothetical protein A7982_07104 [Minicystis rosea]|nr:Hypothetical protein A7982_07104 [Minicystis rosea]
MHTTTFFAALGCVAAMTTFVGEAAAEDAYDDAFAAAAQAEHAGHLDEAARALAWALPFYPQDYALPLALAWIHFRAGRFAEAEQHYRMAHERSPSAPEARLGLALSLERLGRCPEAHTLYEGLVAERPDLAEAQAGQARCAPKPAWRATVSLSAGGVWFPDHAVKSLSGMGTVGGTVAHDGGFFLGAIYRFTRIAPVSGLGLEAWNQHEAYASVGYAGTLLGFSAHYAFLHDGSGAFGSSHHLGMSARVSPFGDIELRGSASLYEDMKVFRLEPSWRIPIVFGLSIRPGFAVQRAGDETRITGMGTLSFDHRRVSVWAGGKYGDEVRPVYFNVPAIYDVSEKIAFGAWAGASVNVSDDVRIHLSYAMDRLKPTSGPETSTHALSLGVAVSF